MKKEKRRHYCANCKTKQYEDRMIGLIVPYIWKEIWACYSCYLKYGERMTRDKGFERSSPLKETQNKKPRCHTE